MHAFDFVYWEHLDKFRLMKLLSTLVALEVILFKLDEE